MAKTELQCPCGGRLDLIRTIKPWGGTYHMACDSCQQTTTRHATAVGAIEQGESIDHLARTSNGAYIDA